MVRNLSRNGQKTLFYVGCACAGAYVAYRYWKKRLLKTIDEGFEEVSKVSVLFTKIIKHFCYIFQF